MRWLLQIAALAALAGGLLRLADLAGDRSGGPPSGVVESYYSSGGIRERAVFADGVRDGPCERFDRAGRLLARGSFSAGRMEGEWRYFRPDGSLDPERSGIWRRGARIAPLPPEAVSGPSPSKVKTPR